jgi:hypothetical protein
MKLFATRWPRAAVWLVCLAALGNARLIRDALRPENAHRKPVPADVFAARFQPLAAQLPPADVLGFWVDEAHADRELQHPGARLYLAQYVFSPRLIDLSFAHRWVIVDSDCPEIPPAIAVAQHWTLKADLHNGVRLYETQVKE